MGENYQMGKDITELKSDIQRMNMLLENIYAVIEYNIKEGNLKEPKGTKK